MVLVTATTQPADRLMGIFAVLGVDWTSLAPYKELAAGLVRTGQRAPPYVFMSYRCACAARKHSGGRHSALLRSLKGPHWCLRVHTRTTAQEDRSFIHSIEAEAAATAVLMTVLSSSDAAYSLEHLALPDGPALRPRVRSALPLLPEPQLLLVAIELTVRPVMG